MKTISATKPVLIGLVLLSGLHPRSLPAADSTTAPLISSVTDFGAKGDGATDDTAAVQAAIDACSRNGTKLVFPAGTFLTGTVQLRSHLAIELTPKAIWRGIGRVESYPVQHPDLTGITVKMARRALIYAENIENISLSGPGMIHGSGESKVFTKTPGDPEGNRPFGIWILRSRNVRMEGIRLRDSAFWMLHLQDCDHVRIAGIQIFNHANVNNDGLDLTDCHNVAVSDVQIDSSDDALCLKSHGGRGVSDVVITNCVLSSHADAFKMGTASVGGFRRITANNLIIRPSAAAHIEHPLKVKNGLAGIDLMATDGGTLEDILIQNVVMDGVETPLVVKLGDRWAKRRPPDEARTAPGKIEPPRATAGAVRNVRIAQVVARHCGPVPSSVTGYPGHVVENVVFSDMLLEIEGGAAAHDRPVPENSGNYPYNRVFGMKLPAYAFFVRHVRGLEFRNIQVRTIAADERRAIVFEDVTGSLDNVDVANRGGQGRPPVLVDREGTIALLGTSRELKVDVGANRGPDARKGISP